MSLAAPRYGLPVAAPRLPRLCADGHRQPPPDRAFPAGLVEKDEYIKKIHAKFGIKSEL